MTKLAKRRARKIAIVSVLIPALVLMPLPWQRTANATIKPPGAIAYPTDQKIFIDDDALFDGSRSYARRAMPDAITECE